MSGPREQLLAGLSKLGLVLRNEVRNGSERSLRPAQAQVLALLHETSGEPRVSDVSTWMGVTLASASETVSALAEKGLVRKAPCSSDARATRLHLTAAGEREAERKQDWPDLLLSSVGQLDEREQGAFLRGLTKIIVSVQEQRRIPVTKMCVTCTYFRPHVYEGARPHHCDLVDARFGDLELRIECAEHVAADESSAAQARRAMGVRGSPEESSSGQRAPASKAG